MAGCEYREQIPVGLVQRDKPSAGQRRALRRLSQQITHRCSYCLETGRYPKVRTCGVECGYCGNYDCKIYFFKRFTPGGFTWMASFEKYLKVN